MGGWEFKSNYGLEYTYVGQLMDTVDDEWTMDWWVDKQVDVCFGGWEVA